jgi:hypothetical protein
VGGLLAVVALGCGGGQSGPTGITEGQALGKFCHELNRSGQPVVLTMQLGDPAILTITARTSVCAPMAGMPCAKIPVGLVPLKILDADKVLLSRSVVLVKDREYVFQPVINNNLQVALTGGQLDPGVCQNLDFPPGDGGARDGGEGGVAEGGAGDGGPADTAAPDAGVQPVPADAAADVAVAPDTAPDAPPPAPDAAEDAAVSPDATTD